MRLLMAGKRQWESPRIRRLCDTLPTAIAPDSMPIAQAKARILGAEHELPTATGRAFVASDARPLVQRHTAAFIAHTEAAPPARSCRGSSRTNTFDIARRSSASRVRAVSTEPAGLAGPVSEML